ncbi:MAG: sulfate ABC transporter substrate-binding protein [Planctomycetia bacterium]|nr:sulfate ABC transporter substrate-binding protein [Planctomycetia bacterium]
MLFLRRPIFFALTLLCVVGLFHLAGCGGSSNYRTLSNVSYDPTRELYSSYNKLFVKHWKETKGEDVEIVQAHGGSGDQAKKVVNGLEADVVTLALAYDIDAIGEQAQGTLKPEWQKQFPNNNCPYVSTIVFLVRKGNPKNIRDWDDLIREDVGIITPNPKTSGGARWNYLAAWAYALKKELGGSFDALKDSARAAEVEVANQKAFDFVKAVHENAVEMPAGARGATNLFVRNGEGDVLLAWENEALLTVVGQKNDEFEIVVPSISIVAEPPVAIVDSTVDKKGTRDLAEAYLNYLYSPEAQKLVADNFYRPSNADALAAHAEWFPNLELVKIDDIFGGWKKVQKEHFAEGGIYDKMGLSTR